MSTASHIPLPPTATCQRVITLTLFTWLSVKRTVVTDGGCDGLFGLPLPYITNNFGCTGCYEVYVGPMIINLVFFFGLVLGMMMLIEKAGIRLRTHWLGVVIGVVISLFWVWFLPR